MVIAIQQLQQLRSFLILGLGLLYLGECFQNEKAKGLKVLVSLPKAKKRNCTVKVLKFSVWEKAIGIQWRELVNCPEECSQDSEKGRNAGKDFGKQQLQAGKEK